MLEQFSDDEELVFVAELGDGFTAYIGNELELSREHPIKLHENFTYEMGPEDEVEEVEVGRSLVIQLFGNVDSEE